MSKNDDPGTTPERTMDLESLKALAHPLRVRIFDVLSTYGTFTASGLAERLGESSGATSYHLRQLEKHGFVREVAGKGVGRERWWERTPGGVSIGNEETRQTSAGREATQLVMREWSSSREKNLAEFLERGIDELPKRWADASMVSVTNVFVTSADLAEFTEKYMELATEFAEKHRDQTAAGTRPVQLQFHGFPVIDGVEIPENDAPEGEQES